MELNGTIKKSFALSGAITRAVGGGGVSDYVTPEMFGAKGDGVTDDTVAIQTAIDSGKPISFGAGKTYKVIKISNPVLWPNGDEPCLYIRNADGVRLLGNGASLKVENHGQGILEIINSTNIEICGLEFVGYGSFPKLDTASGRGEKGTTGEGFYDTAHSYQFSLQKNNSVDTSAYTGFANDASEVWGTFGDGFIGNSGSGILIYGACKNVTIESCIFHGFNLSGVSVGSRAVADLNYSENVDVRNCEFYNIYDTAIQFILAENCHAENNYIHEIGHPDAFPENGEYQYTFADPGYGISCAALQYNGSYHVASNIYAINNRIENCIRIGADAHGCNRFVVIGNTIKTAYAWGIQFESYADADALCNNSIASGNILVGCGQRGGSIVAPCLLESDTLILNNKIINNTILDGVSLETYGAILCQYNNGIDVSGNYIENSGGYGILCTHTSKSKICNNNGEFGQILHSMLYVLASSDVSVVNNTFSSINCENGLQLVQLSNSLVSGNLCNGKEFDNLEVSVSNSDFYGNKNNGETSGVSVASIVDALKAFAPKSTASGAIASFNDGAYNAPLVDLTVALPYKATPYSKVAITRTGINIINTNRKQGHLTSDTIRKWDENCYYLGYYITNLYNSAVENLSSYESTARGAATVKSYGSFGVALPARCKGSTQYYIRADRQASPKAVVGIAYYTSDGEYISNEGTSNFTYKYFTTPANAGWIVFVIGMNNGSAITETVTNISVYLGADYSTVSGTYVPFVAYDERVIDVSSVDIYGGTFNVLAGEVSSEYAPDGTALGTPVTVYVDRWEPNNLAKYNRLYSDCGNVAATYITESAIQ